MSNFKKIKHTCMYMLKNDTKRRKTLHDHVCNQYIALKVEIDIETDRNTAAEKIVVKLVLKLSR